MMDKIIRLMVSLVLLFCAIGVVPAQERMNEFVVTVDESHNPTTIYSSYGATPNDGVVIINSTLPDLEFGILSVNEGRLRKVVRDKDNNRYLLIVQPNDMNYKQYTITINADGFLRGKIDAVAVKAGLSSGYIVNPKYQVKPNTIESPLYVDGWTIYRDGKKLSDHEIRTMFANTESYNLYVNGIKKKDGGTLYKVIIILGAGSVGGGIGGFIGEMLSNSQNTSYKTEYWLIGGGLAAIGIGWLGLKLQSSTGRNNIQKAVDFYNNRNLRSQNDVKMEYGLTGNGVYFSLLF